MDEERTSALALWLLTDGIGWVRCPGIWEKVQSYRQKLKSLLQRNPDLSLTFPSPSLQEAVWSMQGQRAGGCSQPRSPGSYRNRRAFPDLFKLSIHKAVPTYQFGDIKGFTEEAS